MNKLLTFVKELLISKNVALFITCFSLSAIVWFLTTLSKMYIGTLHFPIQYINLPEDKVVISPLPKEIILSVRASGWEIITNRFQKKNYPVVVNINELEDKSYLVTSSNLELFTQHVSPDMSVYDASPDTIYFEFDRLASKKVPIRFNYKIAFKKQFGYGDKIIITPDSVVVSGPQSIIRLKKYWNTEKLILSNVDRAILKNIQLAEPANASITLSVPQVKAAIPVEQYTEGSLYIPINVISPAKDYRFVTYPKNIKISYNVSLKKYQLVKPELFEASVDLSQIDLLNNQIAEIKITQKPSFVFNVNHSPKVVEYLIYK